eukprot:IDg15561t1
MASASARSRAAGMQSSHSRSSQKRRGANNASSSAGTMQAGLVVWAQLGDSSGSGTWWPARILDRAQISSLDPQRAWASDARTKRIVHFFKSNSKIATVDVSRIVEYTSFISYINRAGKDRGAVFLACQDANYWIRQHGVRFQKDRVKDPSFLASSIVVKGSLADVKKSRSPR